MPLPVSTIVTVAAGTKAPLASCTLPIRVPETAWANSCGVKHTAIKAITSGAAKRHSFLNIARPPGKTPNLRSLFSGKLDAVLKRKVATFSYLILGCVSYILDKIRACKADLPKASSIYLRTSARRERARSAVHEAIGSTAGLLSWCATRRGECTFDKRIARRGCVILFGCAETWLRRSGNRRRRVH